MFSLSKGLLSQFFDILIPVDEKFPFHRKFVAGAVIRVFWPYHVLGFAILEVLQSIASSVTFFLSAETSEDFKRRVMDKGSRWDGKDPCGSGIHEKA